MIEENADIERQKTIKQIFAASIELESDSRDSYIKEACGGDSDLRSEVESWLASYVESENFIETPAFSAKSLLDQSSPMTGRRFGNFEIIREIGSGGMGAVYLARRTDGEFEQNVALKIVRQSIAESQLIERFRRERQILASLNHPNIGKLLDGGVSDEGLPYFAMEYIDGESINDFASKQDLDLTARLKLFLKVCSAVAYAHRNLVVHRDLKPGNILVDSDGEPKLLDFGLAKLVDENLLADSTQTQTAFRALTPAYASPEQLKGEPLTTASDIYSLGVVFYELLAGRRPFHFEGRSLDQIIQTVTGSAPPAPSADPKSNTRNPKLRGDLDNIALMALRSEAERRYATVDQFANDIERHLTGLPVSARANTRRYRASKYINRHKAGVAAASLAIVAIVSSLFVSLWQANIARHQRDLANAEKIKAENINQFLSAALSYSDPSATAGGTNNHRDATINQMLDDLAPRLETEFAEQPEIRASLQRTVGAAYQSQLRFGDSERYLNAALETEIKLYGENSKDVAYTRAIFGAIRTSQGDYAAAKEYLQRSIATFHEQPPTDPLNIGVLSEALNESGTIYWSQGDFVTAESNFREALAVASRLEGKNPELVAEAKSGLGSTLYSKGELGESEKLLKEVVVQYRNMPTMRWRLPGALNALGQVLLWSNKSAEALDSLRESSAISLEVWGENNEYYPRSLWLQVYAMCFNGECAAAEKTQKKAEEIYDRIFPDNKAFRGNNYDAKNLILTRTGRTKEGEKFGKLSVELYQSIFNRGAPSITLARIHLSENLIVQKKFDEAETVLLDAYKDASEAQGKEHWRTREVANHLVDLYQTLGKKELAEQYIL